MWNPSHILFERVLPSSKSQEGLHVTHIALSIVSGHYSCKENYAASPLVEVEVSLSQLNEVRRPHQQLALQVKELWLF
jgi:hypothetical protein